MDTARFEQACSKVISGGRTLNGIGTLTERTLHAVLKQYFDPFEENHEVRMGPYVADIVGENGIIEIQTGSFERLRGKLAAFLEVAAVTVVYPVAAVKWLVGVDPDTGALVGKRKSPRHGTPYDVFGELYKIKPMLAHRNLHICVVMLELEEYRVQGAKHGRRPARFDRVPLRIADEIHFTCAADYERLIPGTLPKPFTTKDFGAAAHIRLPDAQTTLHVLNHMGTVCRTGKRGNLFLYERAATF